MRLCLIFGKYNPHGNQLIVWGWSSSLTTVVFEPFVAFGDAVKGVTWAGILFDNQPLDAGTISGGEDGGNVEGAMAHFSKGA